MNLDSPTGNQFLPDNQIRFTQLSFDIQLFAGEKTEPATEKRREEARERGNVPKSNDLDSVVVMLAAFLILKFYGSQLLGVMGDYMRFSVTNLISTELTLPVTILIINQLFIVVLKCLVPIFLIIIIAVICVNFFQVGFMLTFEPLIPDFERLNPISGLQNVLSKRALGELVKSIIKILVVSYVPYSTLSEQMPLLIRFVQLDPVPSMIILAKLIFSMAIKIILILFALAIGDWFFQKWNYEENLKMSKEEIKEEFKQREGDPKVKSKIRERQRKIATKRMMEDIPKATVVVTNPTHIAVALKYQQDEDPAPKVIAMGTGLIAEKIKEIAKAHGVPILENKPLAQALHKSVNVGDEIPADLYAAVAEILAQVLRMKTQKAA